MTQFQDLLVQGLIKPIINKNNLHNENVLLYSFVCNILFILHISFPIFYLVRKDAKSLSLSLSYRLLVRL